MKKKLIIIISILLLVTVILLGVINNYEPFHFTNNIFFKKQSTKSIYKEEYKNIDTIYVDVDDAIINIINGKSNDIKVEILSNRKNINLKSYNSKLSIVTDNNEGCIFCTLNVINIEAPSNFKEYINVVNDYGHVNIESFPNSTISVTNKFGNVSVDEAKVLKVISKRGSVDVKKVSDASIYSFWGTLNLDDVNSISSKSTLLYMNIDNVNKYINIKNDFGNINIKNATITRDSKIDVGFGNIDIENLKEDNAKLEKKN